MSIVGLDTYKDLEYWLSMKGFHTQNINDEWDFKTDKAFWDFMDSRANKISYNYRRASFARNLVGLRQLICQEAGIEVGVIDGLMGPQTEYAIKQFNHLQEHGYVEVWRDEPDPFEEGSKSSTDGVSSPSQPSKSETVTDWPQQSGVSKFFGAVGSNQTLLEVPYKMKLAWDLKTSITRFSCHEKVHDPMKRVLTRVADAYAEEQIQVLRLDLFGGCLNVRKMRGGSSWSMHSWGIAIDIDPAHNRLKWGRDKASLAKPEYDLWWKLWEEEGFTSLGRARNYDWMHIQAADL